MTAHLPARFRSPRFILGGVLFAALLYVGLQPLYARFLFIDRDPWATMLSTFPDRRTPTYPALVARAAEVIPTGASVAVIYPTLEWHRGYSYAYFRAQYFLSGRRIIPLGWPTGRQEERLDDAEWVIVFSAVPPDGEWTVVYEAPDGRIARRGR